MLQSAKMEAPLNFPEWLRKRRRGLDLTQEELAHRVGCSVFALRKIESGERRPSKQLAALLSKSLDISPEEEIIFIRAARGEISADRLAPPLLVSKPIPGRKQPSQAFHTNLPAQPTPLVGRENELDALERMMHDPDCRLLTITGPGGIGKTRLAVELASRLYALFPGGVFYVPLASVSSPAFIPLAMADALGLIFSGPNDPGEQLIKHLAGRSSQPTLLILDNLEHMLHPLDDQVDQASAAALVAEMLRRAPQVKILITSRERLNLLGEWAFELYGLPIPELEQTTGFENYSAIALFLHSARRVRVGYELAPGEIPALVRICHLVEGLPLAIELAASWVPVLSCQEIAREIESNLDFLATSMRDVPERQRSLRAVFDHSWELLSSDECRLLSRLAIFRGGFSRQAAEQVAGASVPALLALVSKSLVRHDRNGRFDLHEVLRQYALSHLDEDPEGEASRNRHAEFYLALLRDRERDLKGSTQPDALRQLTEENDNLRLAWAWAVERKMFAQLGQALRSYGWLCDMRGWLGEGIEQTELVIQALRAVSESDIRQKALGSALAQQGLLTFRLGQYERALPLLAESLAILRPLCEPDLLLDALIISGVVIYLSGDFEQAQLFLDEGVAQARAAGNLWFEAFGVFNQGYLASLLGRYPVAYQQMQAGLALWRKLVDPRVIALALNFISLTAIRLDRIEEAKAFLEESLGLCKQIGDRWGMGTAYRHLGLVSLRREEISEAQSHLQDSLFLFTELGAQWDIARSLIILGDSYLAVGASSEARQTYLDALHKAMEVQATPLALEALSGLAQLYAKAGEAELALLLAYFILGHAAGAQETRDRAGHISSKAETMLSDQQSDAVRRQAGTLSLESILGSII